MDMRCEVVNLGIKIPLSVAFNSRMDEECGE
jgi:hypothetical protein